MNGWPCFLSMPETSWSLSSLLRKSGKLLFALILNLRILTMGSFAVWIVCDSVYTQASVLVQDNVYIFYFLYSVTTKFSLHDIIIVLVTVLASLPYLA